MNATLAPEVAPDVVARRRYVPKGINFADFAQIESLLIELRDRQLPDVAAMERWLADYSELYAAVDEFGARRYIAKSCHTDNAEIEKAFMFWVEQIEPKLKPYFFELKKKFIASPHREKLSGVAGSHRYAMLSRHWLADVELFRPENVPLETAETRLTNDYDKINGAMMISFEGSTYTPQQMARFLEVQERDRRESAWRALSNKRLEHRADFDRLYNELIGLRQQIAYNAGFDNYIDYTFRRLKRFDYTPKHCHDFAHAVEEGVMPVIHRMNEKRRGRLGLPKLRPWDMSVDPKNRPPLRPFDPSDIDRFVSTSRSVFDRLSPDLGRDFESLRTHGNLDLASRPGKQPGGYQSSLEESQQPFIFMNAAGLHRDVETLLHEAGHAFHYQLASRAEPLVFLRSAPMEFCEVASMGMELLTLDHYDAFYPNPSDFKRACIEQLRGNVVVLAWVATIDQFQHWVYSNPNHTIDERTDAWKKLIARFGDAVDWSGCEPVRDAMWQRQLHLYHVPFYYIEYAIAQIGAMQLWLKARHDPKQALANYRSALALGGTRSLPELFTAAGLVFDFSSKTIVPLLRAVEEELVALDED